MPRILVIEDNQGCAAFLETILKREGHEVYTALGSREAFAFIEESCFDLVITDLCMPELEGEDLVHNLRRAVGGIPILVVSALYLRQTADSILAAGANDALGKPFTYWELLDKVALLLRRQTPEAYLHA